MWKKVVAVFGFMIVMDKVVIRPQLWRSGKLVVAEWLQGLRD